MAVQCLPGHPELLAEMGNYCLRLVHSRHGQPDLGGGHLEVGTAGPTACTGSRQANFGSFDNLIFFHIRPGRRKYRRLTSLKGCWYRYRPFDLSGP